MGRLSRLFLAIRRPVVVAALLLTLWLACSGEVFAQKRKGVPENKTPVGKSYVLPYGLVMMAITLGLMMVCRPGKRADEPKKPE